MQHDELPSTAIHGESGSIRVVARVVETTGLPKVVIDFGEVDQSLIGDGDHPHIGFDGTEREVGRLGFRVR